MVEAIVEAAVIRAEGVEGFMMLTELTWLATQAAQLPQDCRIIEVGTWLGRSARAMVGAMPPGLFVAVDHFRGNEEEPDADPMTGGRPTRGTKQHSPLQLWHRWRQEFYEEMAPPEPRVLLANLPSRQAAGLIADRTADLLFVDGSHTHENVRADLLLWLPKLRPGGLACGHNLTTDCPGVEQALNELLEGWRHEVGQLWSWRR
jgi:hypothetical protein